LNFKQNNNNRENGLIKVHLKSKNKHINAFKGLLMGYKFNGGKNIILIQLRRVRDEY